jgi:histidinol-phosphatase
MPIDLPLAMDVATRAVRAASKASLVHFKLDVKVDTKPDRTPVTQADRDAETAILAIIREAFPDHSILSEEIGAIAGSPDSRWIVDPLDGTRGFTRGGQFWGPLVALEHKGEIVAGAMALPVTGVTYWAARGLGTFRDGVRIRISSATEWRDATLSVGELSRMLDLPQAPRILELIRTCASARAFGDIASCAMLLDGKADAWMEGGVRVWDIAPSQILIEEAGGVFTDVGGKASPEGGTVVAGSATLHAYALRILKQ